MRGPNRHGLALAVCILAVSVSACEPTPSPPGATLEKESELANAREWSVVQGIEYTYRLKGHREPFIVIERANGSNLNVIGLPITGQPDGYAWIIANPTSEPAVKQMPSGSTFALTQEQYDAISARAQMHPDVAAFLRAHVDASATPSDSSRTLPRR